MRRAALIVALVASACTGVRPLPTTLFHVLVAGDAEPSESDWERLVAAAESEQDAQVAATAPTDDGGWLVWITASNTRGSLLRVRRTTLGLEAQSLGAHAGPCIRPTIRALAAGHGHVIVVESSTGESSTERDAWLYVEEHARIVPLLLDGDAARVHVRAEQRTPLERGWTRAATLTATLDADDAALVVHEHASVREIAEDRPELPARSTYEVERARRLRSDGRGLRSDGPSLFDETAPESATASTTGR